MKNKRTAALGGGERRAALNEHWAWLSFGNRADFRIEERSIRSLMPLAFRLIYRGDAFVRVIFGNLGQEGENEEQ